jgi:hypothetical protein
MHADKSFLQYSANNLLLGYNQRVNGLFKRTEGMGSKENTIKCPKKTKSLANNYLGFISPIL